jgi:hypothetical protein
MTKITRDYVVISGAYGRDYKSGALAKADFLAGKDFQCESILDGGTYLSIRDFEPGLTVQVRFARMTKFVMVKVPEAADLKQAAEVKMPSNVGVKQYGTQRESDAFVALMSLTQPDAKVTQEFNATYSPKPYLVHYSVNQSKNDNA